MQVSPVRRSSHSLACYNIIAILSLVLLFSGCGKKAGDTDPVEPKITAADLANDSTSLTYKLATEKEKLSQRMPAEALAIGQRFRDSQKASGILDSALNVGDLAPSFNLPNATGEIVSSKELLTQGPIVLTFYRGYW